MSTSLPKLKHSQNILWLIALSLVMFLPGLSSLPVIDRDEARFAQASVQMAESGDMINIRFQDEARNKKPAGAYWAQTAFIKAFSTPGERHIWAQRMPSVLAGLIAIIATYWAGVAMIGRRGAVIAASFLAISILMVFEAHVAKTDALLCAAGTLVFTSLAFLRQDTKRRYAILFWTALAIAVMIKGPVIPAITILTLISLAVWERDNDTNTQHWMKRLLFWPGPILFLLLVLPWTIMIYQETNGQFFIDAIAGDFGSKLVGAQEKHGAPPGAYIATLSIAFWPASLLLFPGLAFAFRAVIRNKTDQTSIVRAMRLALAWVLPYWIVLEIVPTKLPNYLLPVYPALAVMCGGAMLVLFSVPHFKYARRIGAILFFIVSLTLAAGLPIAEASYGGNPSWSYAMSGLAMLVSLCAAYALWTARAKMVFVCTVLSGIILVTPTFGFLLPSMTDFRLAERVEQAFTNAGKSLPRHGGPSVLAPNFTEPSLVYHLGKRIVLGDKIDLSVTLTPGTMIVMNTQRDDIKPFRESLRAAGNCIQDVDQVEGYNYSKGKAVVLQLSEVITCPPKISLEEPNTL
ncbi:MAG: ArnT family glycosyltransferase [Maricaulaceae bacterium]